MCVHDTNAELEAIRSLQRHNSVEAKVLRSSALADAHDLQRNITFANQRSAKLLGVVVEGDAGTSERDRAKHRPPRPTGAAGARRAWCCASHTSPPAEVFAEIIAEVHSRSARRISGISRRDLAAWSCAQ